MKNRIRIFILTLAVFTPVFLFSQPSPNSGGPGGGTHGLPAGGENRPAPIDGGAGLFLLMAIGLGVKRQLTSTKEE